MLEYFNEHSFYSSESREVFVDLLCIWPAIQAPTSYGFLKSNYLYSLVRVQPFKIFWNEDKQHRHIREPWSALLAIKSLGLRKLGKRYLKQIPDTRLRFLWDIFVLKLILSLNGKLVCMPEATSFKASYVIIRFLITDNTLFRRCWFGLFKMTNSMVFGNVVSVVLAEMLVAFSTECYNHRLCPMGSHILLFSRACYRSL